MANTQHLSTDIVPSVRQRPTFCSLPYEIRRRIYHHLHEAGGIHIQLIAPERRYNAFMWQVSRPTAIAPLLLTNRHIHTEYTSEIYHTAPSSLDVALLENPKDLGYLLSDSAHEASLPANRNFALPEEWILSPEEAEEQRDLHAYLEQHCGSTFPSLLPHQRRSSVEPILPAFIPRQIRLNLQKLVVQQTLLSVMDVWALQRLPSLRLLVVVHSTPGRVTRATREAMLSPEGLRPGSSSKMRVYPNINDNLSAAVNAYLSSHSIRIQERIKVRVYHGRPPNSNRWSHHTIESENGVLVSCVDQMLEYSRWPAPRMDRGQSMLDTERYMMETGFEEEYELLIFNHHFGEEDDGAYGGVSLGGRHRVVAALRRDVSEKRRVSREERDARMEGRRRRAAARASQAGEQS